MAKLFKSSQSSTGSSGSPCSDPSLQREKAYKAPRRPWMFEQFFENDFFVPEPAKRAAVFLVHGMGTQQFGDTAVSFRNGFEDAIDTLLKKNLHYPIPPPYIEEGYWGDYDNLEEHFPEEFERFDDNQKIFFQKLWKSRTLSPWRTYLWLIGQLLRLWIDPKVIKDVGIIRWLGYVFMFPTGVLLMSGVMLLKRDIVGRILSDVRLYIKPQGNIELAIIQRIERRVGEQFLRLIGLDWEFNALPDEKKIHVNGKPFEFEYVVWVAHSLGSVVSYNVLSDLFSMCHTLKSQGEKPEAVAKVEKALHRFITIGSPLEKIAFLFKCALREWGPKEYIAEFASRNGRRWWTNFFHVFDPVSGILKSPEYFPANIENKHSIFERLPLWAHVSYWRDVPILSYILTRAYGRQVVEYNEFPFYSPEEVKIPGAVVWIFYFLLFTGVIALIGLAIVHRADLWHMALEKIKGLF